MEGYTSIESTLNGCDTVEKLAEVTGTRFEAEVYLDGVKEVIGSEIK
jgi:hypothetical protein